MTTHQTSQSPEPVGWCHQCGTIQLKREMPMESLPWTDGPEPVCVICLDEPWGLGVWPKGDHSSTCPTIQVAKARTEDWSPILAECDCGGNAGEPDED